MRVIAGSARHLNLIAPEGMGTRPTLDREKETLFNVLGPRIIGQSFLDLFSGSGQIAIEALSRGCESAVLVENTKEALECIRINLEKTKLSELAKVINKDVLVALNELKEHEPFGYVFMDPPYNKDLEKQVLQRLKELSLVDEDSVIVVEASNETEFDYLSDMGYQIIKEKVYKTNKHVFIELIGE